MSLLRLTPTTFIDPHLVIAVVEGQAQGKVGTIPVTLVHLHGNLCVKSDFSVAETVEKIEAVLKGYGPT